MPHKPAHPRAVSRSPPATNTGMPSRHECPVSSPIGQRGRVSVRRGRQTRTEIPHHPSKSGMDQHGSRVTVRIVLRQDNQEVISSDKDERRTPNQSIVYKPQHRFTLQWTPSFHLPPRRGPAPLLAREDLLNTQRMAWARNRRSMPVSPTMGKCIQPYTGPLTGTTGHTTCRNRHLLPQDHSRK